MEGELNQCDLNSEVGYRSSNQVYERSMRRKQGATECLRARCWCQPYLTGLTKKPLSDTTCHRQSLYQDKDGNCTHNRDKCWHLSRYNAHTTYCPTVWLGPKPLFFVTFLSQAHFLYNTFSWSSPEGKTYSRAFHWTRGVAEELNLYKRCATAAARTIMGAGTFAATICNSVFVYLYFSKEENLVLDWSKLWTPWNSGICNNSTMNKLSRWNTVYTRHKILPEHLGPNPETTDTGFQALNTIRRIIPMVDLGIYIPYYIEHKRHIFA